MRKMLGVMAVVVAATTGWLVATPAPAKCLSCYSGACYYNNICGQSCVCMKQGHEPAGVCVSLGN